MEERKLRFETLLLPQGWAKNVSLSIDAAGVISRIEAGSTLGEPVSGVALPGVANVHSHAHQRLMQGLAERAGDGPDSFWSWRDVMYGFALKLSPEDMEAVAAMAYMEMLCAGFTSVGEFQYLHHQPDGTPYDNPAEMSLRCLAAAETTGISVTMLPVLYCHSGFGGLAPNAGQRRFICTVDQFLEIQSKLGGGLAPHSLRAVTAEELAEVLAGTQKGRPVHIHVAEQLKEVEDCVAWSGIRPVQYMLDKFDVDATWCAIHATHMTEAETKRLAESGAVAGLCPTTEANLGDGIFPAREFLDADGSFGIGSDSHISISPAEDLRMLEYSQRLSHHARNVLSDGPRLSTGKSLYGRALQGGAQALQQNSGEIAVGKRADFIVLDGEHLSLLGRHEDNLLDTWIFSAGNSAVRDVYVGGKRIVQNGRHVNAEVIIKKFKEAQRRLS